ncbi:MAG: helix-turn-helix domain-containing protein [Candidatus ainarchaeum sp.]|nr:helix-turn-helix domain-containing protein [Candidatus ainarchaeum sp.]
MAELFCDICGRGPVRAQILVEGAKLLACGSCMRTGKVIQRFHEDEGGAAVMDAPRPAPELGGGEDIVEDWGPLIKHARDKAKLPLAVVAERISEMESYLDAIENGRLMPSIPVAHKLEKELGIKLIEKSSPSVAPSPAAQSRSFSAPTLADMLSPEKKKKGK